MDVLGFLVLTLALCLASWFLLSLLQPTLEKERKKRLPPGPLHIPVLSPIIWLRHLLSGLQPVARRLRDEYGPIFTIRLASQPSIFIADRGLVDDALVHHGAAFSDRPTTNQVIRILDTNRCSINSAPYGPLWRLLRRNLTSGILHPSRLRIFGGSRRWVLGILVSRLRARAEADGGVVVVIESFQYAMFRLLLLMCFGEKLDEKTIEDIEDVERTLIGYFLKFNIFSFFPKITKLVFRKLWDKAITIRQRQDELLIPLIRSRRGTSSKNNQQRQEDGGPDYSYFDSLLDVRLQEDGGRELDEREMVSLCSELLISGTDTTATTLQWIMAELVREQRVQQKLFGEIQATVEAGAEIREEDLQQMPYLKAVILEGLRRHPPGHFLLPHTVSEDVTFDGHLIPKGAMVNFTVADMGWDEKVWASPMEFRPERFMPGGEGEDVDITGSREIKMMPFGVGRRICPGMGLAMLHLQYFVANLVSEFEWKPVDGEEVDLSEVQELTVMMKHPLRARIGQRAVAN